MQLEHDRQDADGGDEHDPEPDGEPESLRVDPGLQDRHGGLQVGLGDEFGHDEIPRGFGVGLGLGLRDAGVPEPFSYFPAQNCAPRSS